MINTAVKTQVYNFESISHSNVLIVHVKIIDIMRCNVTAIIIYFMTHNQTGLQGLKDTHSLYRINISTIFLH